MIENYFFIDGSSLIAQIRTVQKNLKSFKNRKLDPVLFILYFATFLRDLIDGEYKRAVFYFPKGEKTVGDYLIIPNFKKPGLIKDINFKYCGEKLESSDAFNKFVLEKVPEKFQGRFTKSEKGVDIEICCDALKLASMGKIERLVLLTNDDDFVPFCRAIKEFGANISLIHLSEVINPNKSLIIETDSYDVVSEEHLQGMFMPKLIPQIDTGQVDKN